MRQVYTAESCAVRRPKAIAEPPNPFADGPELRGLAERADHPAAPGLTRYLAASTRRAVIFRAVSRPPVG